MHTHREHYRYQKTPESATLIPSFIRAQTHTHVSSTSGRGQRVPEASLCSTKADSFETSDLVYLIDSYPAGHLYKTYNGIGVHMVCVCMCIGGCCLLICGLTFYFGKALNHKGGVQRKAVCVPEADFCVIDVCPLALSNL